MFCRLKSPISRPARICPQLPPTVKYTCLMSIWAPKQSCTLEPLDPAAFTPQLIWGAKPKWTPRSVDPSFPFASNTEWAPELVGSFFPLRVKPGECGQKPGPQVVAFPADTDQAARRGGQVGA